MLGCQERGICVPRAELWPGEEHLGLGLSLQGESRAASPSLREQQWALPGIILWFVLGFIFCEKDKTSVCAEEPEESWDLHRADKHNLEQEKRGEPL